MVNFRENHGPASAKTGLSCCPFQGSDIPNSPACPTHADRRRCQSWIAITVLQLTDKFLEKNGRAVTELPNSIAVISAPPLIGKDVNMAQLKSKFTILACLTLPFVFGSASADPLIGTKALLKDTVAGSPGNELITPVFDEQDNDQDFYPDKITVKFKVYTAGSTNKLFNTTQRAYTPPAAPFCANSFYDDWDWEPVFFGEDNTHTGVAISFEATCENSNTQKEVYGTYVYVGDTTQAGSSWAKSWGQELIGIDMVDWDDDQQDEVEVILAVPTNAGLKLRTIFLDKETGAVESDKRYLVFTSFDL